MPDSKTYSIAGVLFTLSGLLVLSTFISLNRWFLLSGALVLYLGLRFNWRYSFLLQKNACGYFILLF